MDLQQEAVELLQALIRLDTVNPPGNERPAIELLDGALSAAGFETKQIAADPARPNLVARLRGQADGPVLGYLGHVDTVLAHPEEWRHGPWSGDLAEGCVWGRGALDMKSQVAAEAAAGIALARSGWRPHRGELKLMFVCDEETGGVLGAQFLTEEHPDEVRCDLLINEGTGAVFEFEGRRHYGVCVAEKGVFRFTVTTEGVAGHASMPRLGDNALLKMGPVLDRMAARQPSFDLTDEPRALLERLGVLDEGDAGQALERVRARDPRLAVLIEPMLGVTVAPTRISASEKVNVIPSRAHLKVDCRVPPGLGEERALERIREVLGHDGYRLAFDERVMGNRSPLQTPLMDVLRGWVEEQDPGAAVVPTVLPGFTDSRWFRVAFPEVTAYGFFPHRHMSMYEAAPLVHSADERIDVRDLGFAAQLYYDLPQRVLA